jgi:FAD synthetase
MFPAPLKPSTTALYFNGGKEALIILHMFGSTSQIVWVPDPDDFPELTEYVLEIIKDLNVLKYPDLKLSLQDLETRGITTIITGVRRTDPGCQMMTPYQAIDQDWARSSIIRYSPLLDWDYSDVWTYIDTHQLKVCPLYERGYTSIGNRRNTFPNVNLFNGTNYNHARTLKDTTTERSGRLKTLLPLHFSGPVVKGSQRGRTLGFPTANFEVAFEIEEGVYYGYAYFRNEKYPMVLSHSLNHQFGTRTLEVHICNKFDFEFYGDLIDVEVVGYIRPMRSFTTIEDLIQAIQKDIRIMEYNLHK